MYMDRYFINPEGYLGHPVAYTTHTHTHTPLSKETHSLTREGDVIVGLRPLPIIRDKLKGAGR